MQTYAHAHTNIRNTINRGIPFKALCVHGQTISRAVRLARYADKKNVGCVYHQRCSFYIYVGFIDNTPKGRLRRKEKRDN